MSVGDKTQDGLAERTAERRSRAILLRLFLGSIAVNAALGIWALLVGDFGQTEAKVLVTSILVSAAMLSVLANRVSFERRVLWPFPLIASAVAVASFAMMTATVWAEIESEAWIKLMVSGFLVAGGATLASLLALIVLPGAFAPLGLAENGLIALTVLTGLVGIWSEVDEDWFVRLLGVETVLVAALTLALPVIARFATDRSSLPPQERPVGRDESAARPIGPGHPVFVDERMTLRAVIAALVEDGQSVALVGDAGEVQGIVRAIDILTAINDGADLDQVWAADIMNQAAETLTRTTRQS